MESDGTYLMHNNERLSFSEGFQVGVYLERPTFFLFEEVQAYVVKMLGIDEQMEIIGNIFSACESEVLISCDSGHQILFDLAMSDEQFDTLKSFSMNANSLNNFIPRNFYQDAPLNLFGGIWEDEKEQIHVDASTWVQDLDAALKLGKEYNQETIYDWAKGVCIEVN